MFFSDRLLNEIDHKNSCIVVGLDPHYDLIPDLFRGCESQHRADPLKAAAETIGAFNREVIDLVWQMVPVVKPQIAFYERFGVEGVRVFYDTVKYARTKGLMVLGDVKRSDIGSTAQAYADGHIGRCRIGSTTHIPVFDQDAVTVNPYLGSDGIKPFLECMTRYDKGLFILVKTSNPSSVELQDLTAMDGRKIYEHAAMLVDEWGRPAVGKRGYSSVGAVVGATFPEEARALRRLMPRSIFLVPGYGAQGGSGRTIVPCFNPDGYGAIISASRSILFPDGCHAGISLSDYRDLVRKAVMDMNQDINQAVMEVERGE